MNEELSDLSKEYELDAKAIIRKMKAKLKDEVDYL
jgi:hypothetical protein